MYGAFRDLGMFAISKSKYLQIVRSIFTLSLLKPFDAFKEQRLNESYTIGCIRWQFSRIFVRVEE